MSELQTARWIELDGADNVRDLGGLPAAGGASVQPGRLIRSDSLQDLTAADVRHLVDELGVRSVADLRTGVEVAGEGPGPMTREPLVRVEHYSLFPEPDEVQVSDSGDGPVVLPWQQRAADEPEDERRRGASGVYLRYLDERADSVLAALRLIAEPDGATIVHCAAGKDRTGTITGLALAAVGASPDAIMADFAASAERVPRILERLVRSAAYAAAMEGKTVDEQSPRAETMARLLGHLDTSHGGVLGWLESRGWTDADTARLWAKLRG
jgi:hypothetical protein